MSAHPKLRARLCHHPFVSITWTHLQVFGNCLAVNSRPAARQRLHDSSSSTHGGQSLMKVDRVLANHGKSTVCELMESVLALSWRPLTRQTRTTVEREFMGRQERVEFLSRKLSHSPRCYTVVAGEPDVELHSLLVLCTR